MFVLSGRVEKQAIAELGRLFELQTDYREIVLDLKDVSLVDRDVVRFFLRCEADGVKHAVIAKLTDALMFWEKIPDRKSPKEDEGMGLRGG